MTDSLAEARPPLRLILSSEGADLLTPKLVRKQLEKALLLQKGSLDSRKKDVNKLIDELRTELDRSPDGARPDGGSSAAACASTGSTCEPSTASRVLFCPTCSTLLEEPTHADTQVACALCGVRQDSSAFESLVVRSVGSKHTTLPPRDAGASEQKQKARAKVKEACPRCKHPELQYYTMQLRSADEGQTVFYECEACGHTFSTNT
eukprot:CAMPEP_0183354342 /NCGR_PEP_ID=MMETSP0164_2-20130417/37253_1 /TAXON_ID=221442 /ORGANISM="Coccolithus pelagicus ssp braarudi, Strain PLY182g" /LENGTH=205 /DNA_ID=CAMNT_0025527205 /DNA_START=13 /DNA_END=630 /DNA_ORIENTATION=+